MEMGFRILKMTRYLCLPFDTEGMLFSWIIIRSHDNDFLTALSIKCYVLDMYVYVMYVCRPIFVLWNHGDEPQHGTNYTM